MKKSSNERQPRNGGTGGDQQQQQQQQQPQQPPVAQQRQQQPQQQRYTPPPPPDLSNLTRRRSRSGSGVGGGVGGAYGLYGSGAGGGGAGAGAIGGGAGYAQQQQQQQQQHSSDYGVYGGGGGGGRGGYGSSINSQSPYQQQQQPQHQQQSDNINFDHRVQRSSSRSGHYAVVSSSSGSGHQSYGNTSSYPLVNSSSSGGGGSGGGGENGSGGNSSYYPSPARILPTCTIQEPQQQQQYGKKLPPTTTTATSGNNAIAPSSSRTTKTYDSSTTKRRSREEDASSFAAAPLSPPARHSAPPAVSAPPPPRARQPTTAPPPGSLSLKKPPPPAAAAAAASASAPLPVPLSVLSVPVPAPPSLTGNIKSNTIQPLFGRPSRSVSLVDEDAFPGSLEQQSSYPTSAGGLPGSSSSSSSMYPALTASSLPSMASLVVDLVPKSGRDSRPSYKKKISGVDSDDDENSQADALAIQRTADLLSKGTNKKDHAPNNNSAPNNTNHHNNNNQINNISNFPKMAPGVHEPTSTPTLFHNKKKPKTPSTVGAHAVSASDDDYPTKSEYEMKPSASSSLVAAAATAGGAAADGSIDLDYDLVQDHARECRRFCRDNNDNSDVALSAVQLFVEQCQVFHTKILTCIDATVTGDSSSDLSIEQLFYLNDDVLSAIDTGETWLKEQGRLRRHSSGSSFVVPAPGVLSPSTTTANLEIEDLVAEQDIFSLICMLRAQQNERRLRAALALMRFARSADARQQAAATTAATAITTSRDLSLSLHQSPQTDLRFEIHSTGGVHSLLTLFRSCDKIYEIRVVVALAVAYILPALASVHMKPVVGLKIMECLRFLSTARTVTPENETITQADSFRASAMGVTTFWYDQLTPMLRAQDNDELQTASRSVPFGRSTSSSSGTRTRSSSGRSTGGGHLFDQRQAAIGMLELLEMTVELIVRIAKAVGQTSGVDDDKAVLLVEQVCAVQVARSIAVRRGILQVLVDWIRTGDPEKIRPATTALSNLTSIEDEYMAGWIHSQLVKEDALPVIASLTRDLSLIHSVRLSIAQIVSSLCVAPHTRAAVVEANFIPFLVNTLFQDSQSEEVALFVGQALLQLAAGAITRANVFGAEDSEFMGFAATDIQDKIVEDMIANGAIGQLVAIAQHANDELQAVAIEAIRVLSEDLSPIRRTRLHLCEDGASAALGKALKEGVSKLRKCLEQLAEKASTQIESNNDDRAKAGTALDDGNAKSLVIAQPDHNCAMHPSQRNIKQLHESLCALANILDPTQDTNLASSQGLVSGSNDLLIRGCLQTVESGGLESLLWISSLPLKPPFDYGFSTIDLLQESCRSLGSMSPLLLSKEFATRGYSRWADYVLLVFHRLLKQLMVFDEQDKLVDTTELHVSVLQGLEALAKSAPLKVRIIDRFLPYLIQAKTIRDRAEISNAATQAFQSLEVTEDEVAVQVAGSNASLYADWFCLQRSLLIQAMAREEIRRIVVQTWDLAFSEVKSDKITQLIRQASQTSDKSRDEDSNVTAILFENFAEDSLCADNTADILCQYRDTYQGGEPHVILDPNTFNRLTLGDNNSERGDEENEGLLYTQMYPLNNSANETAWILDHLRFLDGGQDDEIGLGCLPPHVAKFLVYCFPSRLLRDHVLPVKSLRPDASFNFRALMMPQRRYFSFRREGQLLSRLWDKEDSCPNPSDFHWTLGFTNSSYAGEFAESLVQVLYLCPMICGLSFVQNEEFKSKRDSDEDGKDHNASDGGSLLANLAGSLPRWISHLTFEGLLNDRDLRTLVKILDTMGKLSAGKENMPHHGPPAGRLNDHTASQVQGSFWFVAVRRSLDVSPAVWQSFFGLLGKVATKPAGPIRRPLSTLKSLDLSGNGLGDELCAKLLGLIHDKDSGCSLEQVDLSGNNVRDGTNVVKVLTGYVQYHRADLLGGGRKVWTAPLKTLHLSSNELYRGKAWFEICVMLKNNALALKVLDLSSNSISLEEDESEILGSSLLSNTSMCHLDLSKNKFSAASIDALLGQLNKAKTDLGLAFLDFSDNEPSLSAYQLRDIRTFYRASRAVALRRFLLEKEQEKDDKNSDDIFEDDPTSSFRNMDSSYLTLDTYQDESVQTFLSPNGENMITVLFSAPLVFEDTKRILRPFAKLDFEMERELMWQCLKEASRDIHLRFDTATIPRLQASMAQRCSCLHYSGHGHEEFLPFEDGKGFPHWVKVEEIKRLIAGRSGVPFRFVFVSACYSGLAGENFAAAGVPHVVCCRQQFELKDAAALAFTRQFYLALAVGNTVKESFDQGCSAVRASPNLRDAEKEMEKFMLLPKDGNHDVPIFNAKPVVEWPRVMQSKFSRTRRGASRMRASVVGARGSELSVRNMMQEAPSPSPPHFFFGREVDMYHVLTHVLEKRLVSVWGEAGVGRSSLVFALCHYINERASTVTQIDHIYYVKAKQGKRKNRVRYVIQKLLKRLVDTGKVSPLDSDGEADIETLFDAICGGLTTEKALVVFDRTEYLEDSDEGNEFPMLLSNLFRETRHVRVLLTARSPLGITSIGGQVEQHHELGPLTFGDTVRLFACLCPYITPAQRRQLEAQLVDKKGEAELLPADPGLSEETKKIFALLGQGIPSKIEESASSISKDDVLEMLRGGNT